MLLRVSGGGIAESRGDTLYSTLTDIDGVSDAIVTRWRVSIQKSDHAEWSAIVPAVKKVLVKFFGKGVRINERTRPNMPEEIGMLLGEAEMDSIRDSMSGCALTEDECDALGIDFDQHNADLRSGSY
ncbi:MAG: hypothetical protein A2816_00430 [Candidatus Yanofskybacteria bacterium RIFCSPHIGHO2_01_FULL_39_44]|nr:MAG: hypothetical protein A2816_00430 [Candidatus Yanofskybacteria bacterium RIFCSPHIGHO2_01_FULL_39_44]